MLNTFCVVGDPDLASMLNSGDNTATFIEDGAAFGSIMAEIIKFGEPATVQCVVVGDGARPEQLALQLAKVSVAPIHIAEANAMNLGDVGADGLIRMPANTSARDVLAVMARKEGGLPVGTAEQHTAPQATRPQNAAAPILQPSGPVGQVPYQQTSDTQIQPPAKTPPELPRHSSTDVSDDKTPATTSGPKWLQKPMRSPSGPIGDGSSPTPTPTPPTPTPPTPTPPTPPPPRRNPIPHVSPVSEEVYEADAGYTAAGSSDPNRMDEEQDYHEYIPAEEQTLLDDQSSRQQDDPHEVYEDPSSGYVDEYDTLDEDNIYESDSRSPWDQEPQKAADYAQSSTGYEGSGNIRETSSPDFAYQQDYTVSNDPYYSEGRAPAEYDDPNYDYRQPSQSGAPYQYSDVTDDPNYASAPWADQVRMSDSGRQRPVGTIITVMAAKGGAGKSTLTLWLAEGITASGGTTAIIDANIGQPDISKMLQKWGTPGSGIDHITGGERFSTRELQDALIDIPDVGHVLVGPKQPVDTAPQPALKALSLAAQLLAESHDFVIIDSPVATVHETVLVNCLVPITDLFVVVVNPHEPTIHDTASALFEFSLPPERGGCNLDMTKALGVINKADVNEGITQAKIQEWIPDLTIVSSVPKADGVVAAINAGQWKCPTIAQGGIAHLVGRLTGSVPIGATQSEQTESRVQKKSIFKRRVQKKSIIKRKRG